MNNKRQKSYIETMETNIRLRPGLEEDNEYIYSVKKTTLKLYVEQTFGGWDEQYQWARFNDICSPEEFQIIQFRGEDIGVQSIEEGGTTLNLFNIEILPEYQNLGIGTYLLKNIINDANKKMKSLHLKVYKVNMKALKLYQRLGFKIIGETDTMYRMELSPLPVS